MSKLTDAEEELLQRIRQLPENAETVTDARFWAEHLALVTTAKKWAKVRFGKNYLGTPEPVELGKRRPDHDDRLDWGDGDDYPDHP